MLQVLSKACPQCQTHLRLSSPSCQVHGTSQWDRWWSLWETCFLNHSWSRISGSIWMELCLRARFYLELSSRSDSTHKQGSLVKSLINWNALLNPLSEMMLTGFEHENDWSSRAFCEGEERRVGASLWSGFQGRHWGAAHTWVSLSNLINFIINSLKFCRVYWFFFIKKKHCNKKCCKILRGCSLWLAFLA